MTLVIVGGGAAGVFAALAAKNKAPHLQVILLEKTKALLGKVRISGGGRCNVTNGCFDPKELIRFYPRGGKELLGPLARFNSRHMMEWLEARGVELKIEEDGRVFPVTDSSETIINCLQAELRRLGIQVLYGEGLSHIEKGFILHLDSQKILSAQKVLLATGSQPKGYAWAASLGHEVIPPVPSLFTFRVPHFPLVELSGVAVEEVEVKLPQTEWKQKGPLLITHWGFSGPAVLKLSAWGARSLHALNYQTTIEINWIVDKAESLLLEAKKQMPLKTLLNANPYNLPRQLWKALLARFHVSDELSLNKLPDKVLRSLYENLRKDHYQMDGKITHKEEFVTCGGVNLKEVDFRTMESRITPGLYFAGEILDLDGVTGGFNLQAAWTTGWIAGQAIAEKASYSM